MKTLTKPAHGSSGEHRTFIGKWLGTNYTGDRMGNDVYCAVCDNYSTVEGTNILYSIAGNCKHCGASFLTPPLKENEV